MLPMTGNGLGPGGNGGALEKYLSQRVYKNRTMQATDSSPSPSDVRDSFGDASTSIVGARECGGRAMVRTAK